MRFLLFLVLAASAFGQFTSNSNGSDGALNITQSGDFDPVALNLDQDGDNIFHFTTINIAQGVTVRLRASKMRRNSPVYWLATGNVTIAGTVDLSGADGAPSSSASDRVLAEPGPGGFPGGAATKAGDQDQRGFGPGSLRGNGCAAGHAPPACGPAYGNALLVPLIGGSGGGGAWFGAGWPSTGAGGGGGGGAIRIASNTNISVSASGIVRADGGALVYVGFCQGYSGPGSGGAIHLQAPSVTAGGSVFARGGEAGPCAVNAAGAGRIRIDATTFNLNSVAPPPVIGPLVTAPLPTVFPSVRVTSVAGQPVGSSPTGLMTIPDLVVNSSGPVNIAIAASGIPVGTVVQLYVLTEVTGTDQFVSASPLSGTLQSSTANASVTLPAGVQRLTIRAVW